MLVRVASRSGWVESDLPEAVALARIAGGTAQAVDASSLPVREVATFDRAIQHAAMLIKKPVARRVRDGIQNFFGLCD